MKRFLITLILVGIAILSGSDRALAQQTSRVAVGPKAGFYVDAGKFMIGAVGEFLLTTNLYFEPGVEFVTGIPNTTLIVLDGNGRYAFTIQGETFSPYVLAGIGLRLQSYSFGNAKGSENNFCINIGGGVTFNTRSTIQPWGGLKIFMLDGSDVALQGGVNFYF